MSEDIFEDTNADAPVIDPEKDYFEEFVGEGKKYKDSKAAGRAILEKDLFIDQLKKEAEEARQELRSRISVEEALTRIQTTNKTSQTNDSGQATSHREDGNGANQDPQGITSEAIDKLVEEKLKAREQAASQRTAQEREEANLASVRDKLSAVYGPNFAAKVKEQADSLGVSTQFLTETGAREPRALFKLLDITEAHAGQRRDITDQNFSAPPRSVVNTSGVTNPGSTERTQAYYDKLRKAEPKRYFSAEVQSQRHKDALRMGPKFFDT